MTIDLHRNEVVLPECVCPWCFTKQDRASAVDLDETLKPEPDDVSVCISCGNLLQFDDDLYLRKPDTNILGTLSLKELEQVCTALIAVRRIRDEKEAHDNVTK